MKPVILPFLSLISSNRGVLSNVSHLKGKSCVSDLHRAALIKVVHGDAEFRRWLERSLAEQASGRWYNFYIDLYKRAGYRPEPH